MLYAHERLGKAPLHILLVGAFIDNTFIRLFGNVWWQFRICTLFFWHGNFFLTHPKINGQIPKETGSGWLSAVLFVSRAISGACSASCFLWCATHWIQSLCAAPGQTQGTRLVTEGTFLLFRVEESQIVVQGPWHLVSSIHFVFPWSKSLTSSTRRLCQLCGQSLAHVAAVPRAQRPCSEIHQQVFSQGRSGLPPWLAPARIRDWVAWGSELEKQPAPFLPPVSPWSKLRVPGAADFSLHPLQEHHWSLVAIRATRCTQSSRVCSIVMNGVSMWQCHQMVRVGCGEQEAVVLWIFFS